MKKAKTMKLEFPERRPKEINSEVATLQSHVSEVMKNVGKYVLISGEKIEGYFDSYRDAVNDGYEQFGLGSFLVRHVKAQETPIRAMRCGLRKINSTVLKIQKPQKV